MVSFSVSSYLDRRVQHTSDPIVHKHFADALFSKLTALVTTLNYSRQA